MVGTPLRVGELAKAFSVSHTPMREALISLQREGIVTLQPRRGFSVARLSRGDLEDLFDLQAYVAGRLAGRAATRLTDEDMLILGQLQANNEDAIARQDPERLERYNYELHRYINRAAQAEKLAWMLRLLVRYVPRKFYGSVDTWLEPDPHFHRSILSALHERSPALAEEGMRAHILHAGESLMEHLERVGHFDSAAGQTNRSDANSLTQKIRSSLAPELNQVDEYSHEGAY